MQILCQSNLKLWLIWHACDSTDKISVRLNRVVLSLYDLAGYVLSRVEKNDATCQSCLDAVSTTDFVQEINPEITRLVKQGHSLHEYKVMDCWSDGRGPYVGYILSKVRN